MCIVIHFVFFFIYQGNNTFLGLSGFFLPFIRSFLLSVTFLLRPGRGSGVLWSVCLSVCLCVREHFDTRS